VKGILSMEVLIPQKLIGYTQGDQDNIFFYVFWKALNRSAGIELIPSTRFPPDDGIPRTRLNFTLMITSMLQKKIAGIIHGGIPIWWWDMGIHMSDELIQMMVDKIVTMIHFLNFWDVGRGDVETYFSWKDRLEAGHGFADLDFIEIPL